MADGNINYMMAKRIRIAGGIMTDTVKFAFSAWPLLIEKHFLISKLGKLCGRLLQKIKITMNTGSDFQRIHLCLTWAMDSLHSSKYS